MVYYKLIMDTRRSKSDSLYPIFVRITYNKTNTTITTGVRVREEHWDANKQLVTTHKPLLSLAMVTPDHTH